MTPNIFQSKYISHFFAILVGVILTSCLAAGYKFNLHEPTGFYYDRTALFVIIKSILNGDYISISSLGYPDGFNFLYFPSADFTQRLILVLISLFQYDVIVISNIYYFAILSLTFTIGYLVFFSFCKKIALSFVSALLFIFTPYLAIRSTGHDFLAAFYCVPLSFWMSFKFFQIDRNIADRDILRFISTPSHLAALLIIALSGIYYALFSFAHLLLIGVSAAYLRSSLRILKLCVIINALIIVTLMIFEIPTLLYLSSHDITVPGRHFMEQSLYGIRFSDLLWTLDQYIPISAFDTYWDARNSFEGYDFWPGVGLSIFGISYLFASPLLQWRRQGLVLGQQSLTWQSELIPALMVFLIGILFFAGVYGIGLIANIVFNSIRSQGRLSPFFTLSFILILQFELQRVKDHFQKLESGPWFARGLIPVGLTIFFFLNSYPFLGFLAKNQNELISNSDYQQDRSSINHTLSAIHATNAQNILQLPLASWPEYPNVNSFQPYHHSFFYIFDNPNSSLRWSYGMVKESKSLEKLKSIENMSDAATRLKSFACLGYDTVLIEKRGYTMSEVLIMASAAMELELQVIKEDPLRLILELPKVLSLECQVIQADDKSAY